LIFSKLWRSRVNIPETFLVKDGSIKTWLFWSKDARCLLRKSYDTLNEKGHASLKKKFITATVAHRNTLSDRNHDRHEVIHVYAPGGRAIFCDKGLSMCLGNLKAQHDVMAMALRTGGGSIQRTMESVQLHDNDNDASAIGAFIGSKYISPSDHCVFVCEVIRNPKAPANMVEARRMGFLQTR